MGKYYLERIHMQAFGRFADRTVGPFSAGLNVVYGKNEAGKTTLNAFVKGVLFGWEDARGSKNVYKPASAERTGSLIFRRKKGDDVAELSRARNADGLAIRPEAAVSIVEDIEKETYATVFALTSDELRGLGDAGDMASRLLTAGSGTGVSPSEALSILDARIATFTSRSASATHSFTNLKKSLDECRARIAQAREGSDESRAEDLERRDLIAAHEDVARELASTNARIEELAALKADFERLSQQEADAIQTHAAAQRDVDTSEALAREASKVDALRMSAADEASLRERIDREKAVRDRLEHRIEVAQDDFSDARARYESAHAQAGASPARRNAAAIALTAILAVAGCALAVCGLFFDALSVTAAGVVCVGVAAVLAAIATAASRRSGAGDDAIRDAYRAMLEKKSILEARESELLEARARVEAMLKAAGIGEAQGSLARASEIVEGASAARLARERAVERMREAAARRDASARMLDECRARREARLIACGFDAAASLSDVELRSAAATTRRDSLVSRLESQNRRIGELGQLLAAAEGENELDVLKTERAQIVTRQHESGMELARLLLARRMMSDAIRAWEGESQPEVYARASELMALMTEGAWKGVLVDESGSIRAMDAIGRTWEPRFLSLGTCQQLYLALRIALLECVGHAGASLPVLADDILVNFDDDRRSGAALALARLAEKRQVIVFTCHKEVVDLMVAHAKDCKVLGL